MTNKEIDVKGLKCEACRKGIYKETSLMDDMNGTLHCSKCNKMVARYKIYTLK
jgi:phage FluMu protein Com